MRTTHLREGCHRSKLTDLEPWQGVEEVEKKSLILLRQTGAPAGEHRYYVWKAGICRRCRLRHPFKKAVEMMLMKKLNRELASENSKSWWVPGYWRRGAESGESVHVKGYWRERKAKRPSSV